PKEVAENDSFPAVCGETDTATGTCRVEVHPLSPRGVVQFGIGSRDAEGDTSNSTTTGGDSSLTRAAGRFDNKWDRLVSLLLHAPRSPAHVLPASPDPSPPRVHAH